MSTRRRVSHDTIRQYLADQEFWSSKMAALSIALHNGWAFSWPADAPAEWTAAALREAANYPARYIEMAQAAKRAEVRMDMRRRECSRQAPRRA